MVRRQHGARTSLPAFFDTPIEGHCFNLAGLLALFQDSQESCPRGTALFAVMPAGVAIIFRDIRAELPFSVEETVDRQDQNVSFVFSTPTCRLTMKIEKEVASDGAWTRLNPEPERK